jgi:hypothetical protein
MNPCVKKNYKSTMGEVVAKSLLFVDGVAVTLNNTG